MRCDECREAISAQLDGEEPGAPFPDVEAHVASCAECSRFAVTATELHRAVRVRAADSVPDLSRAILATASRPAAPREWARYVLLTVALTQLVLALPALFLGHDPGASTHVARELGSFDVALGIGWLVAAWRPSRAVGLLPFAAALAGTLMVTAVLDVADGRVGVLGEAHHVLDVVGLVVLWVLSRPTGTSALPRLPRRLSLGHA
jgi:predicted anti-sigma-YlaC factor YlaD